MCCEKSILSYHTVCRPLKVPYQFKVRLSSITFHTSGLSLYVRFHGQNHPSLVIEALCLNSWLTEALPSKGEEQDMVRNFMDVIG